MSANAQLDLGMSLQTRLLNQPGGFYNSCISEDQSLKYRVNGTNKDHAKKKVKMKIENHLYEYT